MSIAAQRFQFTDNQNVVPVANFYSIDDAGVLNGAIAGTTAAKQALNGSLFGLISGNSKSSAQAILSSALGLDNVSMATRLGIGGILPGINLPKFDVLGAINKSGLSLDNLLNFAFGGNSTFKNIFKTLSGDCLSGIFGNMNCPTNSGGFNYNGLSRYGNMGSCSMGQFLGLLNQYTGGNTNFGYGNICAQTSILRGVTTTSSSMGVPNFFSSSIANNSELSTPAVINSGNFLLNDFTDNNDPYGFMDVANSSAVSNSLVPNNAFLNASPNIISKATSLLSFPSLLNSSDKLDFANNYTNSLFNIDSSWNKKNGAVSVASVLGDVGSNFTKNNNLSDILKTQLDMGNNFNSSDFINSATDPISLITPQRGMGFSFHNALNSSTPSWADGIVIT